MFLRFGLFLFCALLLNACGDESQTRQGEKSSPQAPVTSAEAQAPTAKGPNTSSGNVSVMILPVDPVSTGCIQAVIQGTHGRSSVIWKVNDVIVSSGTSTQLCSDNYKRDDTVTVVVGTNEQGAQASVTIGNSLPRVVDISSTPVEIYKGTDITVVPVAEDADGDSVDFTYQWLINGEADPVLTQATIPGDKFTKGDTIQVLIVPNDFFEDGPTYESYAQLVPNAPPRIVSSPPQGIASMDYSYQVEVSDPDDSIFTFRLDEAPEGMSIDENSGLIQWSLADVAPGDYTIAIIAADLEGVETAQEYSLSLGAPE